MVRTLALLGLVHHPLGNLPGLPAALLLSVLLEV
jgi:hypothetical protein